MILGVPMRLTSLKSHVISSIVYLEIWLKRYLQEREHILSQKR